MIKMNCLYAFFLSLVVAKAEATSNNMNSCSLTKDDGSSAPCNAATEGSVTLRNRDGHNTIMEDDTQITLLSPNGYCNMTGPMGQHETKTCDFYFPYGEVLDSQSQHVPYGASYTLCPSRTIGVDVDGMGFSWSAIYVNGRFFAQSSRCHLPNQIRIVTHYFSTRLPLIN